jgi:DnaJ-class molecular chaperone
MTVDHDCPNCHGRGIVLVATVPPSVADCPTCDGWGWGWVRSCTETVPEPETTGTVNFDFPSLRKG